MVEAPLPTDKARRWHLALQPAEPPPPEGGPGGSPRSPNAEEGPAPANDVGDGVAGVTPPPGAGAAPGGAAERNSPPGVQSLYPTAQTAQTAQNGPGDPEKADAGRAVGQAVAGDRPDDRPGENPSGNPEKADLGGSGGLGGQKPPLDAGGRIPLPTTEPPAAGPAETQTPAGEEAVTWI